MLRKGIVLFCGIFFLFATAAKAHSDNFLYIIGPGDALEILVWRHPDLTAKVVVRPDGKFSYPFVGEVRALDLTVPQLSEILASGLAPIVNQPVVTVNLLALQSQKIFVLGEVNRPGVYPFEGRVTVVEALSKAAGYKTDSAALNSVMVIRKGAVHPSQGFRLNISNVIQKGDFSQDMYLLPGDIVFVPKTFIANVTTFINEFFTKTNPVVQYYLDVYNATNPGVLSR